MRSMDVRAVNLAVKLADDTIRACSEVLEGRKLFSVISGTTFAQYEFSGSFLAGCTVYLDYNTNDKLDAGEPSVLTDTTGKFRFENLAAGTYRLGQQPKEGFRYKYQHIDGGAKFLTVNGADEATALFTYIPLDQLYPVTIGLLEDLNGDGVMQWPAENLAGWDVFVDTNRNGTHDAGELRETTGIQGVVFKLPFGSYRIQQIVKPGWTAANPSSGQLDFNVVNETYYRDYMWNVRLTNGQSGSIQGNVFDDLNRNGSHDAQETGAVSALVFLDTNNNGNADSGERTTTTSATGDFTFNSLEPGAYRVGVAKAGYVATNIPGNNQTLTVTASQVSSLSIGVRPADKGEIRGVVFDDKNGNGTRDTGEPSLPRWSVYLDANNNAQIDVGETVIQTGADGFAFTGLPSGTHRVRVLTSLAVNVTAPTSGLHTVGLATDESASRDFGVRMVGGTPVEPPPASPPPVTTVPPSVPPVSPPTVPTVLGTISGYLFDDLNLNGTFDIGETGVQAGRVYIDFNQNGKLDRREPRRKTGVDGFYGFSDLPSGVFSLAFTAGRGRRLVLSNGVEGVDLQAGSNVSLDVATTRTGQVSGIARTDSNGNGRLDPSDAPLANETLFVDINRNGLHDQGEPTSLSDATGRFSFVANKGGHWVYRVSSGKPAKLKVAAAKLIERQLLFKLGEA